VDIRSIKEDWDTIKKRWEAWWAHDVYDRPLLLVTCPKKKPELPEELADFKYESENLKRKWFGADYLIKKMLYTLHTTHYGGESIPTLEHGWSVGHAVPLGCEPIFMQNTIWAHRVPVEPGKKYPPVVFDENNYWWRQMVLNTKEISEASMRRYFVMPMWGNHAADNLSILRGTENLLFDLTDDIDWVIKSVRCVTDAMLRQFEVLWELSPLTGLEGSVNFCSCWSPKRTLGFDSDFSCMISPEMFKKVFVPPLLDIMNTVDHRLYHLDGPLAAKVHIDMLLSLPEIDAIQWVAGDGSSSSDGWLSLVKKIQAAKKSVLHYAAYDNVIPLLKELRPEGLCICTWAADEDDARRLVEQADKMFR